MRRNYRTKKRLAIWHVCVDNDIRIYAQHSKGTWNLVADCLYQDHHIPAHVLTVFLRLLVPSQMPPTFQMCPLPPEIESWVYRTLRLSSKLPQDPKEQMASTIGAGLVGEDFSEALISETISSWIMSQKNIDLPSLSSSLRQCGTESLAEATHGIWLRARSERPWTKWQRSSQPTSEITLSRTGRSSTTN